MAPPHQILPESEGDLLDDLVGQPIHVLEVGAAGEVGEPPDEPEEGVVRPVGHPVLRHRLVRSPSDKGKEAPCSGAAPREFLDNPGEPEFLVGGEERRHGAEGIGEELEPLGARVRVGESAGDLVLGAKVEFGDIDDLAVPARLLDEVDVGLGASASEPELHDKENTPTQ